MNPDKYREHVREIGDPCLGAGAVPPSCFQQKLVKVVFLLIVSVFLITLGIYYFTNRVTSNNLNAEIIGTTISERGTTDLPAGGNTIPVLLKVESMPSGADVLIDGNFEGTTPISFTLPKGKYEIKVTLLNYYDWEAQIQLSDEGEFPLLIRLLPNEFAATQN